MLYEAMYDHKCEHHASFHVRVYFVTCGNKDIVTERRDSLVVKTLDWKAMVRDSK